MLGFRNRVFSLMCVLFASCTSFPTAHANEGTLNRSSNSDALKMILQEIQSLRKELEVLQKQVERLSDAVAESKKNPDGNAKSRPVITQKARPLKEFSIGSIHPDDVKSQSLAPIESPGVKIDRQKTIAPVDSDIQPEDIGILSSKGKKPKNMGDALEEIAHHILAQSNRGARTQKSLGLENQTMLDVGLIKIGRHLLKTRKSDTLDIVFVIDASKSMRNDIDAVHNHLNQMTDLLKTANLDFTVGLVVFRDGTSFPSLGWDFQVTPQTTSIREIKRNLASIDCRGGEKALDALVQAAAKVKFRRGAERRFILVTDEYVSGSYSPKRVLNTLKSKKVSVSVIGRDEPFQKMLAQDTGGLWMPISSL